MANENPNRRCREQWPPARDRASSPFLEQMTRENMFPITRERYLELAYGEQHPEVTAELEAELPLCLQNDDE